MRAKHEPVNLLMFTWSRFPTWSWFLLAILASLALAEREEEDMFMVQRLTASKALSLAAREACGPPVKWPCDNEEVASFPLQMINTNRDNCTAGLGEFCRLDLSTGQYTPLCFVPQHCFNACGLSPDNEIFCRETRRSGDFGNNFLRVDCPLNMTEVELGLPITPVEGTLCYFGRIPGTYAANFDVNGSFWFKVDRGRTQGEIYELTNSSISDLIDDGTTEAQDTPISSITSIVQREDLNNLADLSILKLDLEQGAGEQVYVVGCWSNLVYFKQVSGNLTNVQPIVMTMVGADPGQGGDANSGAQWAFNGTLYCAYNDGMSGVIQVLLNQMFFNTSTRGTIFAARVNNSAETRSNDGLNCLNAPSPFPPAPPVTSLSSDFQPTTGAGGGDPHIHTLDGQHYTMLNQGSFVFWHFSGVEAETLTDQNALKHVPVDFKIYTHYSGHFSYTKGLLLLDSSGPHRRSLELTSESCKWLTKTAPEKSWRGVEGPEVLSSPDIDGDEMTAFDLKWSKGQKMHVELLMKTQQGFKTVGKLFATCKTGYHLNVKVHMFSQDEVRLVKGQLGPHSGGHTESLFQESGKKLNGQELRTDQDFQTKTDWMELGGSPDASTYLREVDDEGPALLQSCTKQDEDKASTICQKYLGTSKNSDAKMSGSEVLTFQETLADCIFDICVGGGEVAAELAAEILNAF